MPGIHFNINIGQVFPHWRNWYCNGSQGNVYACKQISFPSNPFPGKLINSNRSFKMNLLLLIVTLVYLIGVGLGGVVMGMIRSLYQDLLLSSYHLSEKCML